MSEYMTDGLSSGMMIVMPSFCLLFVSLMVFSVAVLAKYLLNSVQRNDHNHHEERPNA